MAQVKSVTVGLPVADLGQAVEWYRRLLGTVKEIQPAPGVWEFQITPTTWLQLFDGEPVRSSEGKTAIVRFESDHIEASWELVAGLSTEVGEIETVPGVVRYFEFCDPFGNRLSYYQILEPSGSGVTRG